MARKRYRPEEIVNKLREVDVALGAGRTVAEAQGEPGRFMRPRSEEKESRAPAP